MKKIILAVALTIAVTVASTDVRAWEMSITEKATTEVSALKPEHRISLFGTATNFGKSDSVDKYETAYRFATEFESDFLSYKNFSLVPGFYYVTVGIDKAKREYTINPAVVASVRYNLLDFISVGAGYGTNTFDSGGKSGPIYSGKFNLYKFSNDVGIEAGALFSNIGESVNSYMIGVSFPLN